MAMAQPEHVLEGAPEARWDFVATIGGEYISKPGDRAVTALTLESLKRRFHASSADWMGAWLADDTDPTEPASD